jgi:hypothetical protein
MSGNVFRRLSMTEQFLCGSEFHFVLKVCARVIAHNLSILAENNALSQKNVVFT